MSDTFLRGHLNGSSASPGTLMGPNAFGELVVVRECTCPDRFDSVELWTTTKDDQLLALSRDPGSMTEWKLRKSMGLR